MAIKHGINPTYFLRQINQESGFNPNARSGAGAVGIAQIVPHWHPGVDPTDPVASLDYAANWMSQLLKQHGGSWAQALSVYNSGKPDAYRDPNFAGGQTYRYVRTILGNSHPDLRAGSAPELASENASTSFGGSRSLQSVPSAPENAGANALGQAEQIRRTATANLGKIATGQETATDALAEIPQIIKTYMQNTRAVPPPVSQASPPATAGAPAASGFQGQARDGVPVVDLSSIGAEHPTMGLDGYPAYDYFAPSGSAVVAPVSGRVVRLSGHDPRLGPSQGPHGPLGWSVYIQAADGSTYYLTHMGSRNVEEGETLHAGQIIGTVADYARYGTPSHIHMGVNRV